MSSAVNFMSTKKIPVFDGKDYPFWKEKMRIRIKAFDEDMWHVVQNGYAIETPDYLTPDEKRLVKLDAEAKDFICNHLSRTQFLRYRRLEIAK